MRPINKIFTVRHWNNLTGNLNQLTFSLESSGAQTLTAKMVLYFCPTIK